MTSGVATWVKSLGDFPLDPDQGKSWLWSGDGARLIWQSPAAADAMGFKAGSDALTAISHDNALTGFAAELTGQNPDRQPIRVTQLPLSLRQSAETFSCLCRHVPLTDGSGFGLLTVAIGALPRLTRGEPAPTAAASGGTRKIESAPPQPDMAPVAASGPIDLRPAAQERLQEPAEPPPRDAAKAPEVTVPAAPVAPRPAPPTPPRRPARPPTPPRRPDAPGWTLAEADARRPLRFVWQTDAEGRFAHVSRELADAVGSSRATILGKTIGEAATALGLTETAELVGRLAGQDTFTAAPVMWPVISTNITVPVELAGMPVRENGAFVGFRGYGIARIERAVAIRQDAITPAVAEEAAGAGEADRSEDIPAGPKAPSDLDGAPETPLSSTLSSTLASTPEAAPVVPAAGPASPTVAAVGPAIPAVDPAPAATPAAPPAARQPETSETHLSSSERNAFREIARALGQSVDNASPPPAVTDDRPPLSPRQMPAWIARRQQARQDTAPSAPGPEEPDAPAAVVPLRAFQDRLDKRAREGATQLVANLLDRLPLAALVIQQGKAAYANASFLSLAGYPNFAAFAAAGGPDAFFASAPGETGDRDAGTIVVKRSDGVSLSTEAQVTPLTWEDAPATLATFRPSALTAAEAQRVERAEAALAGAQAELQELRFVLDTATDGVLSLDGEGRILAVNRSAEALFGFDKREIIGEPLTALLEPESHAAAIDYLQGLKADGVATIMNDGRDVVGRERHGGRIPLSMTLGRLGGGEARFCAVLRDVTIWKKSEAELTTARRAAESANANKSDFLARISHEIRTPMNAIIGFADVMRNETFGPVGNERYKGYVNDIHASGIHVVSLVNDLLDLSKIAAGKLELTFGSVDLNQVVAESVSMMQPQANGASIIMRMQLAQKLPPVVADQRSLRQIMLNLLSNAAKFTEAGGQVVVTTMLTDKGEAVIRVRDTGVGMNADEVNRAMEPFRQIPGPKSQGGTGLGLPLTRALAEANRAAFTISSEPGKGTLAEVVFPPTRVLAE